MSENKILCGDCLEVLTNFVADKGIVFDLIVADPPFNKGKDYGNAVNDTRPLVEYYQWCEKWMALCFALLSPTGSFYVYTNSQHLGKFQTIMSKYGVWQNTIVWAYTNPTPDKKRFPKTWSGFLFFSKTSNYYFNPDAKKVPGFQTNPRSFVKLTRLSDLWTDVSKLVGGFLKQKGVVLVPGTYNKQCIFQLPKELLERIIFSSTKVGETVLDLFSHSGTTSVVAKEFKRNSVAIEINKEFCTVVRKRLSNTCAGIFVEQ